MGVIKRGILGGFSGSVGNVVGSSWKGIATMKAKPLSVANPNTAAQISERTKLTNIVAFVKPLLTEIIKPLNDRFASGMSGYNLFVQRNISLFAQPDPNPAADLVISQGNVQAMVDMAVTADVSDGVVETTWTDNTGEGNALATDEAYIVAYNETTNDSVYSNSTARNGGPDAIAMPATWLAGHTVRVWAAFRRADGTQVSDTTYATTVIIA